MKNTNSQCLTVQTKKENIYVKRRDEELRENETADIYPRCTAFSEVVAELDEYLGALLIKTKRIIKRGRQV